MTTELPPTLCPNCGHMLDAASYPDSESAKPTPADLSICIGCGALLAFTETLHIRLATSQEFETLSPEVQQEVRHRQYQLSLFRKLNGPPPTRGGSA